MKGIGGIVGDVIGSRFEYDNHRSEDFELFAKGCFFTDDTICTVAMMQWVEHIARSRGDVSEEECAWILKSLCAAYKGADYGARFRKWVFSENPVPPPYNSYGNGSAMRVGPIGWAFAGLEETLEAARVSASVTHNHPEGIKAAQAVAHAIWLLRNGEPKQKAIQIIAANYGYKVKQVAYYVKGNQFDETAQKAMPVALAALQEGHDFESVIRKAVSMGGDTDTIACIAGSMAEACYPIHESIISQTMDRLDPLLLSIISKFNAAYVLPEYRDLTLIPQLRQSMNY